MITHLESMLRLEGMQKLTVSHSNFISHHSRIVGMIFIGGGEYSDFLFSFLSCNEADWSSPLITIEESFLIVSANLSMLEDGLTTSEVGKEQIELKPSLPTAKFRAPRKFKKIFVKNWKH